MLFQTSQPYHKSLIDCPACLSLSALRDIHTLSVTESEFSQDHVRQPTATRTYLTV